MSPGLVSYIHACFQIFHLVVLDIKLALLSIPSANPLKTVDRIGLEEIQVHGNLHCALETFLKQECFFLKRK